MTKLSKVALLDLKREYKFLRKYIHAQLDDCFGLHQWILGDKLAEFESTVANYLGVKYALGVGSGTDALILALRALAIKSKSKEFFSKKDEIITTPFSFVATTEAIIRSGATAVFVDVDPDTFNIDPKQIKKAITKNTAGIIPVHLYGLSCNMEMINRIARTNNLFIVEDVAQAFGAVFAGKMLGTIGDCGAFSFFPSKNLGCYGDAGLVATNSAKLANLIRVLRNHGQTKKHNASFLGYNSRLDSIQAAILLAKLKYIDRFNNLRIKKAKRYNRELKDIGQIQTPQIINGERSHVFHLYSIKVPAKTRDALLGYLNSKGIAARIYYPRLLSNMGAFKNCKIKGSLNNAKQLLNQIISLPIHPFLRDAEISYITKGISRFFKEKGIS
jgi:dTDP-4-amino-4,6-dideoxygalactose transaminase